MVYQKITVNKTGILRCYLTYVLSLRVDHKPQTTCLHPALSCAATSIFLQLYLKPSVHISFSRSLFFQLFFGCLLFLWPCSVHCSACCHHFLSTLAGPVSAPDQFFVHNSVITIFTGHCMFTMLCKRLLVKNLQPVCCPLCICPRLGIGCIKTVFLLQLNILLSSPFSYTLSILHLASSEQ